MEKFRGKHRGRRAFIACNGPSLNDTDVSKLKNEIVFGLNRGYLKKDLKITYLVVVNDLVEHQFRDELLKVRCKAFFTNSLHCPHCYGMLWTPNKPTFTGDPTKPMWQGHTVTYAAMQLAYFMGIKNLYLIGCDHSYTNKTSKKGKGRGLVSKGTDPNHFALNYFGKGIRWDPYHPKSVEKAYRLAMRAYKKAGRHIYNASAYTKLSESIIPRVDFDSLFE